MMDWTCKPLQQNIDASASASLCPSGSAFTQWLTCFSVFVSYKVFLMCNKKWYCHGIWWVHYGCTIGSFLKHSILPKTIVLAIQFWGSGLCEIIMQFIIAVLLSFSIFGSNPSTSQKPSLDFLFLCLRGSLIKASFAPF
jgi:hypothetical protein